MHRAVIALHGGRGFEAPRQRFGKKACLDGKGVFACKRRHEAHGVLPVAIVKTIGLHALLRAGKDAANPLLRKGIALFGAANVHFKHIPALDLVGEAPFLLHKPHFLAKC